MDIRKVLKRHNLELEAFAKSLEISTSALYSRLDNLKKGRARISTTRDTETRFKIFLEKKGRQLIEESKKIN